MAVHRNEAYTPRRLTYVLRGPLPHLGGAHVDCCVDSVKGERNEEEREKFVQDLCSGQKEVSEGCPGLSGVREAMMAVIVAHIDPLLLRLYPISVTTDPELSHSNIRLQSGKHAPGSRGSKTRTTMASSSSQSQQVAVTDLDLPQLSEVRRQLEEVSSLFRLSRPRRV